MYNYKVNIRILSKESLKPSGAHGTMPTDVWLIVPKSLVPIRIWVLNASCSTFFDKMPSLVIKWGPEFHSEKETLLSANQRK